MAKEKEQKNSDLQNTTQNEGEPMRSGRESSSYSTCGARHVTKTKQTSYMIRALYWAQYPYKLETKHELLQNKWDYTQFELVFLVIISDTTICI